MLKEILKELRDAESEAAIEPELTNPNVQAGAFAIKRNAERRIAELTEQYKSAVQSSIKVIALTGEYSKSFADIAESKYQTITHNYLGVLNRISDAIKDRTPRDTFAAQEYWMLLDELNKIKYHYGIEVLPAPQLSTDDHNRQQDISGAVKDLIERTMGSDLYAVVAQKELSTKAFNARSAATILPVIIYNYQDTNSSFLPQPVGSIEINEPVTDESVKDALIQIREKLTGETTNKQPTKRAAKTAQQKTDITN
jgi:hypothetical protein